MAGVVAAKLKLKKQQEAEEEAKVNDLDPHTFAQLKHNCTQDNIENNNEQVRDAIETVSENFQVVTLTLSQYHTRKNPEYANNFSSRYLFSILLSFHIFLSIC